MSISSRLRELVKTTILGLALATSSIAFSSSKAKAEITYPLSTGQVVRFYLDNGQGINITNSAGLVNNGLVNSYAGSNTDPEQQFRVVSDGSYYLFVRNNTNFALSSSTLTPTNGSPVVSYTAGNGAWQNLLLDRIDASHFLIKWQANQNYCVHIPNGAQNVQLKLTTCNASDTTQRFNIYTTGGLPNYVSPVTANSVGVLESAAGARLALNGNNTTPNVQGPNDNDPAQKIQFIPSGNGYVLQRNGTNYSLSSNTLDYVGNNQNGLAMTTYTTGAGRWQNFGFTDAGNGYYNIKLQWNPAYCVSAGNNSGSNFGLIVPCSSTDLRQRFRTSGVTISYQDVSTPYYYGVFASGGSLNVTTQNFIGHTWTGFTKIIKNERKKFVNGVYDSSQVSYITSRGTVSSWPNNTLAENKSEDLTAFTQYLNGNPDLGFVYRLKIITEAQYNSFSANRTQLQKNCFVYPVLAIGIGFGECNCTQASIAYWTLMTGETINASILTPVGAKNAILNSQNNQSALFTNP